MFFQYLNSNLENLLERDHATRVYLFDSVLKFIILLSTCIFIQIILNI